MKHNPTATANALATTTGIFYLCLHFFAYGQQHDLFRAQSHAIRARECDARGGRAEILH